MEDEISTRICTERVLHRACSIPCFPPTQPANGEEGETPVDDMNVNDIQAGCTAVVALVHQGKMHVANAGDSRAIVSRTGMAEALSIDHKPSQETEKSRIEVSRLAPRP